MTDPIPVSADTPCVHCGYNLRTLDSTGQCPECGAPVSDSTGSNLLRAADAHWLKKIAHGAAIKCWSLGIYFVLFAVAQVLWLFERQVGSRLSLNMLSTELAAMTAYVIADWELTSPQPHADTESRFTLRYIARVGAVVYFAAFLFSELTAFTAIRQFMAGRIFGIVQFSLLCVYALSFYRYMALLVGRVPDMLYWRQWIVLMWASMVLPFLITYLPSRLFPVEFWIALEIGLHLLAVWQLFLLLRLRKQLLKAAHPSQ